MVSSVSRESFSGSSTFYQKKNYITKVFMQTVPPLGLSFSWPAAVSFASYQAGLPPWAVAGAGLFSSLDSVNTFNSQQCYLKFGHRFISLAGAEAIFLGLDVLQFSPYLSLGGGAISFLALSHLSGKEKFPFLDNLLFKIEYLALNLLAEK